MTTQPIYAVIGVRHKGPSTFYVKRSLEMENYPGVWSLFSIRYRPEELLDPNDLQATGRIFERMSAERLGGVPVRVKEHLTEGASDENPMNQYVSLQLYEIDLPREPNLNPRYYTESDWLSPEEYEDRCAEQRCGLCLRLWSDYAWCMGITDRPFIPHTPHHAD
ncbi:MAG: hypothetical protein QOH04_2905 [Sphingomonadales bacterium]|jgi:hypothetical protein|nr:hypothetical protein [Sphingomonadales bacterium]